MILDFLDIINLSDLISFIELLSYDAIYYDKNKILKTTYIITVKHTMFETTCHCKNDFVDLVLCVYSFMKKKKIRAFAKMGII